MNCFEARKEFISFWRRTMPHDQRPVFMTHLRGCARCDRSFRIFALSAPVLHSAVEPEPGSTRHRPLQRVATPAFRRGASLARNGPSTRAWSLVGAAVVMAAAAVVVAIYVATPPRVTLEDALGIDNTNVELATYTPAENLFGQEILGQDPATRDSLQGETTTDPQDDLAR